MEPTMPIHDFQCQACNARFELLVRSSAPPVCPVCASANLAKQVSAPAAQGKSAAIIAQGRAQAAREGHFSNY
jgi:putative FmdB family regulatory protein